MGSWHYAYLFESTGHILTPEKAIDAFSRRGLEFDNTAQMAQITDERGHLAEVGDEVVLANPIPSSIRDMLIHREQFAVQCRNEELFFSCVFACQSFNPHIFIGWSRNLFSKLSECVQEEYWEMIRDFAAGSHAGYVILANDADELEDRFLEIDNHRFLDTHVSHEYGHGIWAVWVNEALGAKRPDGSIAAVGTYIGDSFRAYEVH